MRKLFAALTRNAFAGRVSFSRKVFGKNPNNGTTKDRLFVEKLRGSLFDLFSQSEELLHTRAAFCSLRSREFIKRGIADLTHENLVVVQHGKPESVSFLVMPLDFVTDQRHGQYSPQTNAGSPRLPQPASQINGLTATLSRKVLLFLIALVSIAFGVCSPARAQISLVSGQVASAFTFSSVTSLSAALPNNPGTNHLVLVCAAIQSVSSQSPITAQDGDGNNYTLTASSPLLVNQTGQQFNLAAAYLIAPAPVSNSKTITVSWANAVAGSAVWAAEFQGNAH
jgi:hypothetical protein